MTESITVVAGRLYTRTEIERLCEGNLFSNVPEQIYFKDLDGRFLRVSKVQADLFGVASPEEVLGRPADADQVRAILGIGTAARATCSSTSALARTADLTR